MKQFEGKIIFKVQSPDERLPERTRTLSEEASALDTEVYLNTEVAAETYRRFGVHLRVHIGDEKK